MKKIILSFIALTLLISYSDAQLKDKLKLSNKEKQTEEDDGSSKKKLSIGERLGKVAGNLMTAKTIELDGVVANISYICGFYPPSIETSEAKFMPGYVREGDYLVGVSFLKNEGIGMYNVQGKISANNKPLDYIDLGAYGGRIYPPTSDPIEIKIEAEGGDVATFIVNPVPSVELLKVNGETALPILDLAEDITIEFTNPKGSEGTRIRVSLITDVMGARALNHFADFDAGTESVRTVTIPKESLANPEIVGALDVGNFNKGENYLIIEREFITNKDGYSDDSQPGDLAASQISARSYSAMPVIVKGKQEEGILTTLKVSGKSEDKTVGYEFFKPNAQTGIPFSEGSKFGLVSFTMEASTFKEETETSSSSWTVGNTRYTQTTITTTTYEFPQLPDEYWDYAMDKIYNDLVTFFKSEYNIEFVPVENVTGTEQYANMFSTTTQNVKESVKRSYKGTQRSSPQSISEIFGSTSTNITSDNPTVNMMKNAGDIDGLISINLNLQVGSNGNDNVVLIPRISFSISGRDETNNDKLGKYFDGYVMRNTGEAFNGELVKSSKEELLRVISHPQMIEAMKAGIATLREKEIAMGYDKIWSIGE